MPIEQDWNKSNLETYLLYGLWYPGNAFRVLAGLDYNGPGDEPHNEFDPDFSLDGSAWVHGSMDFKISQTKLEANLSNMKKLWGIVDRLQGFWEYEPFDHTEMRPPKFFIDWAISKRCSPKWLDWAIRCGLYTLDEETRSSFAPIHKREKGRREQQIEAILETISELKLNPQQIPIGQKAQIKTLCLNQTQLFTGSGFDHAWKAGSKEGRLRLANSEIYSRKEIAPQCGQ